MNIYLTGFMGSGKSRLGKHLAQALDLKCMDTDRLIEEKLGIGIPEIFSRWGEAFFREEETALIHSIREENALIVTGGGLPCFNGNMEYMRLHGYTVYLQVPLEILFGRLRERNNRESRPLLKDKSDSELRAYLEETLKNREKFYKEAHFIFDPTRQKTGSLKEHLIKVALSPITECKIKTERIGNKRNS